MSCRRSSEITYVPQLVFPACGADRSLENEITSIDDENGRRDATVSFDPTPDWLDASIGSRDENVIDIEWKDYEEGDAVLKEHKY